jgi:hypothetical protein
MRYIDIPSFVAELDTFSCQPHRELTSYVARSFGDYQSNPNLTVPAPQKIRAGRAGGLPFESLTTDLFLGCLPGSLVCYGNCFAARGAFQAGIDFGKRVENILDEDVFRADLDMVPDGQRYLKNGWNSDPSWSWSKARRLAELIRASGRHVVFITKIFTRFDSETMSALASLGVELRISISAFDTAPQLEHRLQTMEDYREHHGIVVPQLFTTIFKDAELNGRQDHIAQYLVDRDFPAAENSLRLDPASPVLYMVDQQACREVADTGDLWCGRLYPELRVPALTGVPTEYLGLQSAYLSENDPMFVASLWRDGVPTREMVLSDASRRKPIQCGVSMKWQPAARK